MIEFTDDWVMHKTTLGEGSYGEVKLLVNKNTNEKVACKIINLKNDLNTVQAITKEILIHKLLHHKNIIRYYGRNRDSYNEYIYLEFAARGELFQMIEPGIGMPTNLAQLYMKQLMKGLQYIHSKGVVHRDIKPENLLIDENGILKISDFGLATIFKLKGKERILEKRCGTKPYCAPEIYNRDYRGPPVDIWSSGIVLLTMLAGELPWSNTDSEEFHQYKTQSYLCNSPWCKLGNVILSLLRKILCIDVSKRFKIEEILNHPWMKYKFDDNKELDIVDGENVSTYKGWNTMMETGTICNRDNPSCTLSQPVLRPSFIEQLLNNNDKSPKHDQICFSQPVHNDDLILSSQIQFTQSQVTPDNFNLIKRMMRIFVTTSYEKTLEIFCSILDRMRYSWHADASGIITVTTVDTMKNQLIFKINLIEMDGKLLIDFRLAKGCGIEFKKKFIKLKESLKDIVDDSL